MHSINYEEEIMSKGMTAKMSASRELLILRRKTIIPEIYDERKYLYCPSGAGLRPGFTGNFPFFIVLCTHI